MTRNLKTLLTLGVAVLLVSSVALARGGRGPGRRGGGFLGKGALWAAALDLSEEQQAQVKALRQAMRQELTPVRDALRQKHEELRTLWEAEQPDGQAILAKHAEIGALHQQVQTQRIKMRLQILGLLSPEQQQKRVELMKQGAFGPPHGPGFGPGPGGPGCGPGLDCDGSDLDDEPSSPVKRGRGPRR